MGNYLKTVVAIFYISTTINFTYAQQQETTTLKRINTLIEADSIDLAQKELKNHIQLLKSNKNYDSLVKYVFPLGRIALQSDKTTEQALSLAAEISTSNIGVAERCNLKIEQAKIYFETGEIATAFEFALEAKELAEQTNDQELLIKSEYYLGDYALRTGNIEALETHIRSANQRIIKKEGLPYTITARVLNLMGVVMFFSTKQDSAQYYFESALNYIPNLEDNVENKLYLPAAISGNLFLISLNKGAHDSANKYAEKSLRLNQQFLSLAPNHPQAARVKRNLAIGYVNLSSLHYDLGDYDRSENIMTLAYDFAQQNFEPNTDQYFNVVLGMADVKNAKQEFKAALPFLNAAEECLTLMKQDNAQLRAYLYNVFGNNAQGQENLQKALQYYELSDKYYEEFNPGEYDANRLYQSMNMGELMAKLGHGREALSKVQKTYDYLQNQNGSDIYQVNVLLLSLARINTELKDYEEVLKSTEKSLEIYNEKENKSRNNKLHFEEKKGEVILLNTEAKYVLSKEKDTVFLKKLVVELNEAIKILEARKSVISSPESVNILIADNKTIFDFSKKLNLELFAKTGNQKYLNEALNLHESSLYNKIRVRLNINEATSFSGIPDTIVQRENSLRGKLNIDSDGEEDLKNTLEDFLTSKTQWNSFLDSLQQEYPKYYKMRYATIGESLENIQKTIPQNTTVIRYFFVDETLYAYVVSKEEEKLFPLDYSNVEIDIAALGENQSDIEKTSYRLNELYQKLWKPFEAEIQTNNVVIIPDGALYNLSFETLSRKPINSFKDLAKTSLLSNYNISYNYSLYLLESTKNAKLYDKSFVAFAPEFSDDMKENYKVGVTDSISLDKTYLTLLQQPFNVSLAKTYSNLFNGESFINESSTESIFKQNANEHKIIHIGTHAESNNISPELSRLIFAKDVAKTSDEDGSLYTYEIYNTSLNSNLAILTACETGKPTYQAGEGMISLAHAFNYAGSESILTSLWKVDERSSAEIIELFYENIKSGKSKDKALRLAKLDYIKNTDGRTVAPQFWAGLVLMGDTAPITISNNTNWLYWFIGLIALLLLGIFLKNRISRS